MALHYTISTEKTACGRTATSANATSITADVTCKTCCKSEAFVSAAPAAAINPNEQAAKTSPVAQPAPAALVATVPNGKAPQHPMASPEAPLAQQTPNAVGGSVAFEEWRSRLGSNDRLPRGKFTARRKTSRPARSRATA